MCNRIRKIADRCCCTPPTPPPNQSISWSQLGMSGVLPWDLQARWYPRALAPLPPTSLVEWMLPRGEHSLTPSSSRRSQEDSVTYRPLSMGPNHYRLFLIGGLVETQPRLTQSPARTPGLTTISTEPCVTVASRNTSNQNEREGDLFMLHEDSSDTSHLVMLATLCFASFRHNIRHWKLRIFKKEIKEL